MQTCKPAGGRRGGEQPGRRSLEGVGGVLGFGVNFWGVEGFLLENIKFQSLVCCGLAGSPRNQFSAELNGRREFPGESESFIVLVVLLVQFSSCFSISA